MNEGLTHKSMFLNRLHFAYCAIDDAKQMSVVTDNYAKLDKAMNLVKEVLNNAEKPHA